MKELVAAITLGDTLTFKRVTDGYDAYVYGVNQSGIATGTQFETGVGWVGVTTYMDNQEAIKSQERDSSCHVWYYNW